MLMKVVLLQRIRNLGDLGAVIQVKAGYGRNYLIPQGSAVRATKENIAQFETRRAELEKVAAEALAIAQTRAEQLKDFSITILSKALEEGKLFGSVGVKEIIEALAKEGITVDKHEVSLPHGAIKEVGETVIELHLHSDVIVPVQVKIEAEK